MPIQKCEFCGQPTGKCEEDSLIFSDNLCCESCFGEYTAVMVGGITMSYRYGLINRPAAFGAIPNLPHEVDPDYRNERMNIRHGIVSYAEPLTDEQVAAYELVDMQKPHCGLCVHLKRGQRSRFHCHAPVPAWVTRALDEMSLDIIDCADPETDGLNCALFSAT
jgi:hypothetical protein